MGLAHGCPQTSRLRSPSYGRRRDRSPAAGSAPCLRLASRPRMAPEPIGLGRTSESDLTHLAGEAQAVAWLTM